MANLQAFGSALATVAAKTLTPPKFIYNIARENNYSTLHYLLAGRMLGEMLRGGSDVRARIKLTASSKAGWYNVPAEEHAPQISEDGAWVIAYWCAHMAQESWKEEELLINSGGTTEGDVAEETWTQELWSKRQSLVTSLHRSLTQSIWATPNLTTMGGTDPQQPYSIPAIINEFGRSVWGRNNADVALSGVGEVWTTIHGVNPASVGSEKFVPYRASYGASGTGFTANNADNLVYHLALAMRKTHFAPPPLNKEYFDPEGDTNIEGSNGVVICSAKGMAKAEHLYRSSQDRWADWMDPAGNPKFKQTMFVYEAQLDSAAIYPNHGTLASASGLTSEYGGVANASEGPRYYGLNNKYLKMYFHRKRFLEFLEPFREAATTWTQHVNTLGLLLCPDRSTHFLLSPNGDN